jgi:hypothetical protein
MSSRIHATPARRAMLGVVALVSTMSTLGLLAQQPSSKPARLPLGPSSLAEERAERKVGEGFTYTHIVRGHASPDDFWTLRVMLPSRESESGIDPDAPAGMLGSKAVADAVASKLESLGLKPEVRHFATPALPNDVGVHDIGYAVSVGRAASSAGLAEEERRLRELRLRARPWHTSYDGDETTGPWDLHVLTIDPRSWSVTSSLGESLVGRETVRSIAARAGATAAVNGGFFVMQPFDPASGRGDGEPGDPVGLAVIDGRLVSEATIGRPALLLRNGGREVIIDRFTTRLFLETSGGERHRIDGLNRIPGVIRNCGGVGGDVPTERPAHDFTCSDPSEIVAFTPDGFPRLPAGPGVEVVLDAAGTMAAVRERSGAAPPRRGWVLQATGDEAEWLRREARVGRRARVTTELRDSRERPVRLGRGAFAVNGGPMLVERGAIAIDADRDGLVRHEPGIDNFFFGWVRQRNPRTMVGVDAHGRLLLVAADGRQAHSAGLSILEAAQVMRALGAVTAMNLDGGGSTTLVLDGQLVNRPSDRSGEREDGDAILVTRRRLSR